MSSVNRQTVLPGLSFDEPMARHTSWRVGGPADMFFKPQSLGDLQQFLAGLGADVPVYFVGLGSNLLVRDAGVRGAVINTLRVFNQLDHDGALSLIAGAGVPCTRVARKAMQLQLGPAEFLAGIPGTVGGALSMNAGAFGGETWERIRSVRVINRAGDIEERTARDFDIEYRSVRGAKDEWFVEAHFQFEEGYQPDREASDALLQRRKESQPLGLPSCGSVFRNPPGDFAARLIESSGLKGFQIGDAQISEKHANFVINRGEARAADIEAVIEHMQATVFAKHDIELRHEVRMIGERA